MHRHTYLEKDVALGNSGERTTDINIQDPITALWLEMRCNNGTTKNLYNPMHFNIDAVEIIDGSTVVWSLDGAEMLGLVCAQLGFMPTQKFNEPGNDPQTLSLPILFGNFIGDKERSFDPRRFVNPQVRVKWNLANVNAVGATGFATGGLTMTLIAEVMEGAPAPRSMLSAKEVYTYTAAAGTEYVDLPTDHPYKGLMVRAVATTSHWWEVISNLKLNLDGGKEVPFDIGTEDLQYQLFLRQPRLHYRHWMYLKDQDTLYSWLKEYESVMLIAEDLADTVYYYSNYEYGQRTVTIYTAGSARTSYVNTGADIHGYFPFHCVYIPFGDQKLPAEWFQAQNHGSVRLELTGLLARSVYLCLLQDRPY